MKKVITDEKKLITIFKITRFLSNTRYIFDTLKLKDNTVVYKELPPRLPLYKPTVVNFIEGGTLEIGTKYTNKYHTALLNFADGRKPGGWPEEGCLTQEENLCRCTNLYETLISDNCNAHYYEVNKQHDLVGMCTSRVIYCPNVAIFRDDNTYELKKKTYADIITCPAPSCRFRSDFDAYNVYLERIEQIILSAIENNVECLVLGAWGCGAFGQNPTLVAEAFVSMLNDYSGYFDKIVFAIKGTPGWGRPNSSYHTFLDVFKHRYIDLVVEGE